MFFVTLQPLWAQMMPISFLSVPKERGFDVDVQASQSFMVDIYQIQTIANVYHRDWSGLLLHDLHFNPEASIHSLVVGLNRKLDPHLSLLGGYGYKRVSTIESNSNAHSISVGLDLIYPKVRWQTRIDQLSFSEGIRLNRPIVRTELSIFPSSSFRTYLVVKWPLRQSPEWQLVGAWDLDDKWTLALLGGGMTFRLGLCVRYQWTAGSSIRMSNQHNLVLGSSPSVGFHYDHQLPRHSK
jgi:hypothetical protein